MELTFKVNRSVLWLIIVLLAAAFGWRLYKRSAASQARAGAAPEPEPEAKPTAQPAIHVVGVDPAAPGTNRTAYVEYDIVAETAREVPAAEAEQRNGADRRRPVAAPATNRSPRANPFQRKSKDKVEPRESLEEKIARLDREAMDAGIGAASAIKDQQLRQDQPETAEVFAHV